MLDDFFAQLFGHNLLLVVALTFASQVLGWIFIREPKD